MQPSLPALLGTLMVAASLFAACAVVITPEFLTSIDYGYLMSDERDEYARLTTIGLRLQNAGPPSAAVVLLGASAMREAISDAGDIERLIAVRSGRSVPVYDLMAGGLDLWQTSALIGCLGRGFTGVVVLGVSPGRLARDRDGLAMLLENPRLGLHSAGFDEEVRLAGLAVPRRTGVYFLDHFRFFVARRWSLLRVVKGPAEPMRHPFLNRDPATGERWESLVERQMSRLESYYQNREANLAVIERAVERLRRNGSVEVVLLEASRHPALVGLVYSKELWADHRRRVGQFAHDHDVHYWDLQTDSDLSEDDFADYTHLRSAEAVQRYTRILAERLTTIIAPFITTVESR